MLAWHVNIPVSTLLTLIGINRNRMVKREIILKHFQVLSDK